MLTHVPHIHSCSHTYAPTYSHTLKIPYYTHTQIHTCSHIYVYIHTLKDIPTQYTHVCTHSHRYTLSHTHILSHKETHSHTYQNTLIYALHTHTSHFTLTLSHFTLTLHTHRFLCKFKHTHSCMHTLIHTFKHTFTHPLTLENQAGPRLPVVILMNLQQLVLRGFHQLSTFRTNP